MLLANQKHSHNDGQLGKLNSNCTSLLRWLGPLPKIELFYFTKLDPESEIFSIIQFLLKFAGGAKDYDKAIDGLSDHFKHRKNAPMARQTYPAAKPSAGETINNFITRLQKFAEHCDYEAQRDNQVRVRAIYFIKDRNLKAKL